MHSKRPAHTARTAQQTRPAPRASCAACALAASGVGVRSRKYLVSRNARVWHGAWYVYRNSQRSRACENNYRLPSVLVHSDSRYDIGYSITVLYSSIVYTRGPQSAPRGGSPPGGRGPGHGGRARGGRGRGRDRPAVPHEAPKLQIRRSPNLKKIHIGAPVFSNLHNYHQKRPMCKRPMCILREFRAIQICTFGRASPGACSCTRRVVGPSSRVLGGVRHPL